MSTEETDYVKTCQEIIAKLKANQSVSRTADFPNLDAGKWSYAHRAIMVALQAAGWDVQLKTEKKGETRLDCDKIGEGFERRYHTEAFPTATERDEKRKIGRLASLYIGAHNRRVLFGSGSTVFWVGRALAQFPQSFAKGNHQEFWTFNPALASYWCEFSSPFDQIGIVDGLLDCKRYRYRRLGADALGFPPPVFVFGADGCYYDIKEETASLYALQSDISANTDAFLKASTDSVLCCLTSRKLEYSERQNAGEKFAEPENKKVQKILVTDQRPKIPTMTKYLEDESKGGWKIVSKISDWMALPEGPKIASLVKSLKEAEAKGEKEPWNWAELE